MMRNILVIDDEVIVRDAVKLLLTNAGFFVKAVGSGAEAVALIKQKIMPFAVAIVDYHMPDENGAVVLSQLQELDPNLQLMVFSGDSSEDVFNEVLQSGAITVLTKAYDHHKILGTTQRLYLEYKKKTQAYKPMQSTPNGLRIASVGMVGESSHLADVADLILKFSPLEQSILIRGENGTGKEKVALAIHQNSRRSKKPYIAINCAAIPAELVESELFGSEKGAFTGAIHREGKFQAAKDGTIFLDEIGDMPLPAQAALLRVLQEKEVTPVGSNKSEKVNVRVVAATNCNLEEKIKDGTFRQDLFYRLNALTIRLLPLRERMDDIPPLVTHFLSLINKENGTSKTILETTVKALQRMPWYGNARELYGAIARMYALSPDSTLKEMFLEKDEYPQDISVENTFDYEALIYFNARKEKELVLKALSETSSILQTAKKLGVPRSTLRSRMKSLNIENPFSLEEK